MVYDHTEGNKPDYTHGFVGFAIHEYNDKPIMGEPKYSLYTDDGKGNGDYILGSEDIYWIRRAAYSMDWHDAKDFDYNGNRK